MQNLKELRTFVLWTAILRELKLTWRSVQATRSPQWKTQQLGIIVESLLLTQSLPPPAPRHPAKEELESCHPINWTQLSVFQTSVTVKHTLKTVLRRHIWITDCEVTTQIKHCRIRFEVQQTTSRISQPYLLFTQDQEGNEKQSNSVRERPKAQKGGKSKSSRTLSVQR